MKKYVGFLIGALALSSCGQDAQIAGPAGPSGPPGPAGAPGPAASPNPYDIVETIVPCGRVYADDEVLLRLADGRLLMSYNYAGKASLTEVSPGRYRTTDRKSCLFTVNSDLTVTW